MKKLLSLTNLICFSFFFASCQNVPRANKENTPEIKPTINDTVVSTETTKSKMQTSTSGTVDDNGKGITKDTTLIPTSTHAIKHGAPYQAKIDSIKNAKLKGKK